MHAQGIRTYSRTVQGALASLIVAGKIIYESQWFEFTPLPDDIYEFTVKEENRGVLDRMLGG